MLDSASVILVVSFIAAFTSLPLLLIVEAVMPLVASVSVVQSGYGPRTTVNLANRFSPVKRLQLTV